MKPSDARHTGTPPTQTRVAQDTQRTLLWRVVLALLLLLPLCVSTQAHHTLRCPRSFLPAPLRQKTLWHILQRSRWFAPAHRRLRKRQHDPLFCFGDIPNSVVTANGILLLNQRLSTHESAARAAHLLMHLLEPITFTPHRPCPPQVHAALLAEARAMALELQLRRELHVKKPLRTYAFTTTFWRAQAHKRIPLILHILHTTPRGAPGIPPLKADYSTRCRNLQRHQDSN